MSGIKRGRGGKNHSTRLHGDTSNGGTSSTPQSRRVISPRSLQLQLEEMPANSPPTQASSVGSSHTIKKGKGVYKYFKVDLRTRLGAKIPVKLLDSRTRALGAEARNLANYCGYVVRTTISFCHGAEWKNIYEHYKDEMILKVKDKFEPFDAINEEKFKKTITLNLKNAFRNWKTNLHKYYNKYASDEDRRANPPQNLSSEDWELLLTYFQTDMFKEKSKRNKNNREKQVTKHTCGPRLFEEINFATTDLQELLQQQQEELQSDARMTSDEILTTILGKRSGYVRGKGDGVEPLRKRARSQSNDNSAVENLRTQLHEEFDKKFQKERAKMEANLAEERAKMATEHAKMAAERAKMAAEHAQFEHKMEQMEQRIRAQLAALMQQGQLAAPTSSTFSLAIPQVGPSS